MADLEGTLRVCAHDFVRDEQDDEGCDRNGRAMAPLEASMASSREAAYKTNTPYDLLVLVTSVAVDAAVRESTASREREQLACARDPHVRRNLRVIHDERAAAFYALAHARSEKWKTAQCVERRPARPSQRASVSRRPTATIYQSSSRRPTGPPRCAASARTRSWSGSRTIEKHGAWQADLPPADRPRRGAGELGEVSSNRAAACMEEDPVRTRSGKRELQWSRRWRQRVGEQNRRPCARERARKHTHNTQRRAQRTGTWPSAETSPRAAALEESGSAARATTPIFQ